MSETDSPQPATPWTVLCQRSFGIYMAGETISMLGTWMQQFAQGWVVSKLAGSGFALGLVNFASGLPMLLLTLYGGVVADRFDKRRILLATLAVQAVLAVLIGYLVGQNQLAVWHIVLAGISLGTAAAFEIPAAAALVPELVAKDQLRAAISVDRSVFHATRLAGPALGGLLIAGMGMASAFYANALSFGALALALVFIQTRAIEKPADEDGTRAGLKEGFAYVRGDQPTLAMIIMLASITLCISPFFMILMPLYSQQVLRVGPEQHGWLMAASGVGAFAGSLFLFAIPVARRRVFMFAGIAVIAIAMARMATAGNLTTAIASMIGLTLGTSTLYGLANTIVQERAPDYIRGRVSAISGMSFLGVLPFSGLVISKFSDYVGLRVAMGTGAACFAVIAMGVFFSQRVGARVEASAEGV